MCLNSVRLSVRSLNIRKLVKPLFVRIFPSDIDDHGSELKKEDNFTDVQKTTSMKTKNTTSTPLLLTFKEK